MDAKRRKRRKERAWKIQSRVRYLFGGSLYVDGRRVADVKNVRISGVWRK